MDCIASEISPDNELSVKSMTLRPKFGKRTKRHEESFERGLFTGGISRISPSLNSLESLENGQILLCCPRSGDFLASPKPPNSLLD